MALGDQVGKVAVDEVVGQLPAAEAFVQKQLTSLQATAQAIVATACSELDTVLGATLADLTAERTEAISSLHAILDRLGGVTIQLHIPARKESA